METREGKQKVNAYFCICGTWGPWHHSPLLRGKVPHTAPPAGCVAWASSLPLNDLVQGQPALSLAWAWHVALGTFLSYWFQLLGAPFQSGVQSYRGNAAPKWKGQLLRPPQVILMDGQPAQAPAPSPHQAVQKSIADFIIAIEPWQWHNFLFFNRVLFLQGWKNS